MRKGGVVFLLAVAILSCGCGAEQFQTGGETETGDGAGTAAISMYDLRVAMEGADDTLPDMLNASSAEEKSAADNFAHVSDMDYGKVDSYFVSYAREGGKADEIVVIAVKEKADVKEAEESLKEHRQKRYKLLEQYEPAETKRIEDGVVFTDGRYAVLIICDNSGAVRKAFEQMVDGK